MRGPYKAVKPWERHPSTLTENLVEKLNDAAFLSKFDLSSSSHQ